jgi:ferric iron reductase protein FhuF
MLRDGILLDLRPARVAYAYRPETGFRLTLTEPAGYHADPETLRRQWCADVLDDHLQTLVDGVRRDTPVAAGLLWGNVASGLAGALRALAATGAVPPERCHATGLALLAHGPLANSGELTRENRHLRFMRRSCCLYYRLPGGGTCGDCPLG